MAKLNKKTYTKMMTLLEKELETVCEILQLASETKGANFTNPEQWNERHDQKSYIEKSILDLHQAYQMRDWTYADYALNALVLANAD